MLRRLVRQASVSEQRATQAIEDLQNLRVTRYPHDMFLPEVWKLRNNWSAYDAAYLVLAKKLGATLATRDTGLRAASGLGVKIEMF